MKKILLFASALAGLFLAGSCQRENLEPVGGNTVTYTVTVPDALATKGIGDDVSNVNTLHYEVYRTVNPKTVEFKPADRLLYHKTATVTNGTAKIELELVNDQNFTVLFWAQVQEQTEPMAMENEAYNVADLTNVTLKSSINANQVDYAAFSGVDFIQGTDALTDKTILLTRPVAQINLGTTVASLRAFNTPITLDGSSMTVVGLSNTFDVAQQAASGEFKSTTVYDKKTVPTTDPLTVNSTDYVYVGMNYAGFAHEYGTPVTVSYGINTSEGLIQNTIENVPVKPNYRTNIVGNLITSKTAYTIELDERWGGADLAPEEIYLAATIGGEVTLTEDITLIKPLEVKARMTINLNGKTITTGLEEEGRHHYAILNNATLVINGEGTIKARGIKNLSTGNLTVNGDVTITNIDTNGGAAIWNEGTVTINGGTYSTSTTAGEGSYGAALNTRTGGTAVVNGGNFSAYSQLTYAIINEGTTTINNATVVGKHGAIAGSVSANTVINGGSFSLIENPGVSDHCAYKVSSIKGGTFTLGNNTDCGAQVFYDSTIAAGYKAVSINGVFHVFPEVIANAATAANVTAVTESTADVATALATNNGEATMFMWNDVAYIAKYGEVVIVSDADEATTVRGIVEYADGLTSATVAEGIEVVGNRTFRKCANLETVNLPNTLTEIGPAVFQSCSNLANVTIPANVTTIGEGAFAECTSLTSINIPDGITRLENDVLRNTGLVSIEIPASVNYIGTFAFRDCKQLKEVIINAPEFTVEANAFGVMAGALPGTTIYVANAEMKAYLESTLAYKNQFTIVAPNSVSNAEELTEALAKGENVVMTQNINTEAATTAPYGNKYAFKFDGGVLDGNEHELHMECYGDDYGIMTSGGTIKNLTIKEGCRAVMIMYPQSDVILDNVNIGGDGVLYPINTGEAGAEGVNLIVTNSVLAGWTSYGNIESASFTNVEFKQGTYYNNIYGRVLKPYVNTTLTNCAFVEHMNLDLSDLTAGHKVTMNNCTVNGQAVNAGVFTIPTTDAQYDTELFTIDLPSWASSINDCVFFN